MRRFLQRFAECGVLRAACEASGMSARSYYNLADRDPLFAAGVEAARLKARDRLADETFARGLNGCIERIYKDGVIVAERHRHDNRLAMAVLARLDARIDRAEARGEPHLRLVARWDEYLDALGGGRQEDGLALLVDPGPATVPAAGLPPDAGRCELIELHADGEAGMTGDEAGDTHDLWREDGRCWTDYPPPPGFSGEQEGDWDHEDYRRTLTAAEQAAVDRRLVAERAADRAHAEAQRDAFFGFVAEAEVPPRDSAA